MSIASASSDEEEIHWEYDTFMRAYHCLVEDSIRPLYLARDDIVNKKDLYDDGPGAWAKALADKFNDATFAPKTLKLPDLHPDFGKSRPLLLADQTVTAQEVKTMFSSVRAKLLMMISSWEHRGNTRKRADRRALGGQGFLNETHVIYFWHLCNEKDLLASTLGWLDSGTGGGFSGGFGASSS